MEVFIVGATGYIGFSVAQAFRRAGHKVWGLARTEEKARILAQNEIQPVLGCMQHPESYREIVEKTNVLVHTAFDSQNDSAALDVKTTVSLIRFCIEYSTHDPQPKTLIYTSGVWVYGHTQGGVVDESSPLNPIKMIAWRPEVEQMILDATAVNGVVIRPGCVYGKQGGLTGNWFRHAVKHDTIEVVGNGSNRWATVHVDDLAEAYRIAASNGFKQEIFNVVDKGSVTVGEMVNAVVQVTGHEGEVRFTALKEASQKIGDFAEALGLDQQVDAGKAARVLRWQPRHCNFVDEIGTYFDAWKAYQK